MKPRKMRNGEKHLPLSIPFSAGKANLALAAIEVVIGYDRKTKDECRDQVRYTNRYMILTTLKRLLKRYGESFSEIVEGKLIGYQDTYPWANKLKLWAVEQVAGEFPELG